MPETAPAVKVARLRGLGAGVHHTRTDERFPAAYVMTYAADGHPLRISIDEEVNAVDDEVLYTIGSYGPDAAP